MSMAFYNTIGNWFRWFRDLLIAELPAVILILLTCLLSLCAHSLESPDHYKMRMLLADDCRTTAECEAGLTCYHYNPAVRFPDPHFTDLPESPGKCCKNEIECTHPDHLIDVPVKKETPNETK